ncbi:MAG: HDIG domain-containing protein [Bacteroidales bacterium]
MINKIKEKLKYYFRGLLFVVTIALIALIMPSDAKFRYDIQKGKPWLHETLIAPFDFPVYKSEEVIEQEQDSVKAAHSPYFVFDSTAVKASMQGLRERISQLSPGTKPEVVKEELSKTILPKLQTIYKKGVIEKNEEFIRNYEKVDAIAIVNQKVAQKRTMKQVYTPKSAYELLLEKTDNILDSLQVAQLTDGIIDSLSLYHFVQPNLYFDAKTTEQMMNLKLDELSLTKGMIQQGELIVSKGQVVDHATYEVLASLKKEYETKVGYSYKANMVFYGNIIFVFAAISVLFLFLYHFRRDILSNSLKITFILILVLLMVGASSVMMFFDLSNMLYLIPFALVPIIIRTFYDARLALFIHIIIVLLVGFFAPNGFEFVFLNFTAGIVAIFSQTSLNRRGKLFLSAALVVFTYAFVYFGLAITRETDIRELNYMFFLYFLLNGFLLLLSHPLIYLFEKVFGFLSDITLLELSDTNQPLLRELAEKAPGTFQHSLQVANLAEESIRQIGGNPLLVRTGALYHDIGKMNNPAYFIENQRAGFNPHKGLDFDKSAEIIIRHVTEGIEIAKKAKLPEPLIDFIRTHHGTSTVQFFYKNYIAQFPERESEIYKFTYPGPRPSTKEMAVVMMADSVEAASRSLTDFSEEKIRNLVESIISKQQSENQFDYVDLTFRDVTVVKNLLIDKLINIYHARIKYPGQE